MISFRPLTFTIFLTLASLVHTAPATNLTSDLISNEVPQHTTPKTITSSSKPRPNINKEDVSSTELPDFTSYKNTSTFTCYGKVSGFYADVKLDCRVYHFCTQLESIGDMSYQRTSYLCVDGTIFDQKDLNCVKQPDLKVPCDKAEEEYEKSNTQFNSKDESQPSMSDNLAANILMNPITRFIAG